MFRPAEFILSLNSKCLQLLEKLIENSSLVDLTQSSVSGLDFKLQENDFIFQFVPKQLFRLMDSRWAAWKMIGNLTRQRDPPRHPLLTPCRYSDIKHSDAVDCLVCLHSLITCQKVSLQGQRLGFFVADLKDLMVNVSSLKYSILLYFGFYRLYLLFVNLQARCQPIQLRRIALLVVQRSHCLRA